MLPSGSATSGVSLSLARRISLNAGFAIALAVTAAVLAVGAMWALTSATDRAIQVMEREAVGLLDLSSAARDTVVVVGVAAEGEATPEAALVFASAVDSGIATMRERLMPAATQDEPSREAALLVQAEERWRSAVADLPDLLLAATAVNDPIMTDFYVEAYAAADLLREAHRVSMERVNDRQASAREMQSVLLAATVVAMLGLIAFVGWRVRAEQRLVLEPVRALQAGADRAARGDYSQLLPVGGPAELAALADALNTMMRTAEEREALLVEQALRDPLTGLGNRTMLHDRLTGALARRRPEDARLAFMLIDLDGFKHVNDTRGHSAGDEAIRIVGERLAGALREGDTLVRLGGDEFAIVADDVREDGAIVLAERLRDVLQEPFLVGGRSVTLTGSIGVVDGASHGETCEDLLRTADIAMYRAKRAGGDQVCVYDEQPLQALEPALAAGL